MAVSGGHHPYCTLAVPAAIERLEKASAVPELKLEVTGGGVPEKAAFCFQEIVLIERRELRHLLELLRRIPAECPEVAPDAVAG